MPCTPNTENGYNCLFYYQNKFSNLPNPNYEIDHMLPTINCVHDRKCPIYAHKMRRDFNVYNSYDEWFVTQKNAAKPKPPPGSHNNHRSILDKLEETYWTTWKPKNNVLPEPKVKFVSINVINFCDFSDKPMFQEHKVTHQQEFNKPAVAVNDDVTKYFKVKHFETSISDTMDQEGFSKTPSEDYVVTGNKKLARLSNPCRMRVYKQHSVSQEIQTEMHGFVVLKESRDQVLEEKPEIAPAIEEDLEEPKINAKPKKNKENRKATENEAESCNGLQPFGRGKDSIEIIKKKQEQGRAKEYLKQHKCIRLYRKSGTYPGYIKGGTYTLRSCLQNEGSFRLRPPGSTLFITYSSFLNKKLF